MIRLAINGILGRMGQEITNRVMRENDLFLVGGVDTLETFYSEEIFVSTNPEEVISDADMVIDFSSGEGTATIAKACARQSKPLITGTTGLSNEHQSHLKKLSQKAAVIQAFNFSIGINLLINIIQKTAEVLKGEFDGEIIEVHHRHKKDAPSGTALLLGRTLLSAAGLSEKKHLQFGRSGNDLKRGKEVTLHSLRGGAVIGEHQVHFLCDHETIDISHRALSRSAFVDGVLRAIRWIPDRSPGFYTMQDVLKLTN